MPSRGPAPEARPHGDNAPGPTRAGRPCYRATPGSARCMPGTRANRRSPVARRPGPDVTPAPSRGTCGPRRTCRSRPGCYPGCCRRWPGRGDGNGRWCARRRVRGRRVPRRRGRDGPHRFYAHVGIWLNCGSLATAARGEALNFKQFSARVLEQFKAGSRTGADGGRKSRPLSQPGAALRLW